MSFLWMESAGDPRQAEYARAYHQAITHGSIDSAISWELGGYQAKDGSVVTSVPEEVKDSLRRNPKYVTLVNRVDSAVRALRPMRSSSIHATV